MEHQEVHIENLYREKHEYFAGFPPEGVWKQLEQRLDNEDRKKRFFYRWYWYVFICVGISLIYILFRERTSSIEYHNSAVASSRRALEDVRNKQPDLKNKATAASHILSGDIATLAPNEVKVISLGYTTKEVPSVKNNTYKMVRGGSLPKRVTNSNTETKYSGRQLPMHRSPLSRIDIAKNHLVGSLSAIDRGININGIAMGIPPGTDNDPTSIHTVDTSVIDPLATDISITKFDSLASKDSSDVYNSRALVPAATNKHSSIQEKVTATTARNASLANDLDTQIQKMPASENDTANAAQKENIEELRQHLKAFPFSFGIRAGYELGMQSYNINKFIVTPYVQYAFSKSISIEVRPGIKFGRLSNNSAYSHTYYNLNGTTLDSGFIFSGGTVAKLYTYRHIYDSLIFAYKTNDRLLEFEMPILLRFNIQHGYSFAGGLSLSAGKLISTTESRQIFNNLVTEDSFIVAPSVTTPPDTAGLFVHTGQPFSTYSNQGYQASGPNPLRLGLMVGIGYNRNRFSFELLAHQSLSGISQLPKSTLRRVYSQPYFRITVGYNFR